MTGAPHSHLTAYVFFAFLGINALIVLFLLTYRLLLGEKTAVDSTRATTIGLWAKRLSSFLIYESLTIGAIFMVVPFYWMIITSFKDQETSNAFPPKWLPYRVEYRATAPDGREVVVTPTTIRRREGEKITVVPVNEIKFEKIEREGYSYTTQNWDKGTEFQVDPKDLRRTEVLSVSLSNFVEAWYAPEEATRGNANFARYFYVSIVTGVAATIGTLITGALAAFAFARLEFWGKGVLFYVILATMMVPGQVLLIPNFLILSGLHWLDTYAALTVPWLASVFTIFLMRQFFMTIPNDLWDAAQIDGASRLRFLFQVVIPLSKPVFITAGIFNFLNNWNSLLWPLIVTSRPEMRTLMVGLQTFVEDAGSKFHLMMAASTMAILPVVILFFVLQRFFIEGIARTGLK